MAYKHGVGVVEQETSLTTPVESTAGLQIIFGTAPVHLLKHPAAAVNKPILCYSFAECQQNLGYSDDFENFTLCQSMDACFRVFSVAPIVLVNVLDPAKEGHTRENEEADFPVVEGVVRYPKPFVLLDTLTVKNADTPLTEGVDYLAEHAGDGAVTITAGAAYTPDGTEMTTPFYGNRVYEDATADTLVNGTRVELEAILLKDDAGNGYTYYKLRDLGQALNFQVGWSAEQGIYIHSDQPYEE